MNRRRHANAIVGLSVCGFKSISSMQRISIRPLTILAGANSSGKSSMMQPLLLLKQTLEAQGDPGGALQLDGPNVRFTSAEQLLNKRLLRSGQCDFSIVIEMSTNNSLKLVFKRKEGIGFEVVETSLEYDSKKISIKPGMSHDDIMKMLPKESLHFYNYILKESKGSKAIKWTVGRERFLLSLNIADGENSFQVGGVDGLPRQEFTASIQQIIHLPGLRGNPSRTYPKSSSGPLFPGTFELYSASIIADWQNNKDNRITMLGEMLEEMGLTWKVAVAPIADTQYELKVGRLLHSKKGGSRDMVSIADVGFGVSQTLPVLVSLLAASRGQLIYLEQPEIHLHPNAQRKLAAMLLKAIARGAVIVAETHSSLLLREIQTLVARDLLSRKDIILHWFKRCDDGSSEIVSAELDENGAFGDWPEDFDMTELEAESNYLNAVEARKAKKK